MDTTRAQGGRMSFYSIAGIVQGIILLVVAGLAWRWCWDLYRRPLRRLMFGREPSPLMLEVSVIITTLFFGVWGLASVAISVFELL